MKYFRIVPSSDRKEVGDFPQVQEGIYQKDWDSPNAFSMINFKRVTDNTEVPFCKLSTKAKLTDLISTIFVSKPLISDGFKKLIETYKIKGVEFVQTKIQVKGKFGADYWFINPYEASYQFLNFEESRFEVLTNDVIFRQVVSQCLFSSVEELRKAFEVDQHLALEKGINHTPLLITKMVIDQSTDVDFFSIGNTSEGLTFIVSGRLKEEIGRLKLTGIKFLAVV